MNKFKLYSLVQILLVSFLLLLSGAPKAQPDKPNILFISIDDLNDWIGVMNTHPQVQTPNIDRLAERGTLFTNAHVQAPLCNPSRVSVMTGHRPTTTGIYNLAPLHNELDATKNLVTIPEYFEDHGYSTYAVGKIFHSASSNKAIFQHEGTETRFFGPVPDDKIVDIPLDMVDHPLIDWGVYPAEDDSLIKDYQFASWAIERLEEFGGNEPENPFFLAVGFWLPHVPLYTTQKWFDLYPPENEIVLPPAPEFERDDVPGFAWKIHWHLPEPRLSWLLEHNQWHAKVRAYLATTSFIDAQVGRVLDALDENGFSENTVVVLWSDHGYHLGEKGITGKNSLWERSTRVPLIFAGPGVPEGGRSSQPAELLDIYPTLNELTGLPAKDSLEGLSLVPQIVNGETFRERPAITTHNPGNHSVRSHRWRYIRYADGSEELYDHSRDPHEWSNLAGNPDYSGVIEEHAKWLPRDEAAHAPGSRHRLLIKKDGEWYWEDEQILFENLIR